jgi:hypothetical protein
MNPKPKTGRLTAVLALACTAPLWAVNNSFEAAHNDTLTTYASGLGVDAASQSLLNWIAPIVNTQGETQGSYKKFVTADSFRTYTTAMVSGDRNRVVFNSDDGTYACKPNGLEIVTTRHEQSGKGEVRKKKIRQLVDAAFRSRELAGWTYIAANVTATGGVGVWSNAANDPVAEIDAQLLAISIACCGNKANRIIIPLAVWNTVKNHALVKARIVGLTAAASLEQIAGMLLHPVEIKVADMAYETAARGKTTNVAVILSAAVYIFIANDNPTEMDLSAFKTFSTAAGLVGNVESYKEKGTNDVDLIDWSEDLQVTAAIAIRRITVS